MTSRERILTAIAHREPDRVPVDLGATPSSGISAIAYNRLKQHLGLAGGHTRIYDVVQQLAQPEMEILDRFRIDVLDVGRTFNTLEALVEIHLQTLERVCAAVGDVADILRFGDDLGMDNGPFMAPRLYRRFFKSRHAALCNYVHQHSQMHTFLHSCGSIHALLPDLIEAGFEIINPVQTSCKDMEPERLKREFGRDITFWGGGCDTRRILNRGQPQEVKDQVRRRLKILAPGGGFVFNTVHNILPDVPPANIEAMFEAIEEF